MKGRNLRGGRNMSAANKIAVAGATGRVGHHVVDLLTERGHDVVRISRSHGVDVITGEGLADALAGVECIVDTATGPSPEQQAATEFFTTAVRSALSWSSTRTLARLILTASASSSVLDRPPLHDPLQGRGVDVVELASALALAAHEAGRLEHVEVLRDRLSRQPQAMLHRQPGAELEERLTVSVVKLIEDGSSRRRGKRMEDVAHAQEYRQVQTCLYARCQMVPGAWLRLRCERVPERLRTLPLWTSSGALSPARRDTRLARHEAGAPIGAPARAG